jgi:hypothetical protein
MLALRSVTDLSANTRCSVSIRQHADVDMYMHICVTRHTYALLRAHVHKQRSPAKSTGQIVFFFLSRSYMLTYANDAVRIAD